MAAYDQECKTTLPLCYITRKN